MQYAQAELDIGNIKLQHTKSAFQLVTTTSAVFISTTSDNSLLQQRLNLLIDDINSRALYINRSNQFAITCNVEMSEELSIDGDSTLADLVMTLLADAEMWKQMRWTCISREQEWMSSTTTRLTLCFINDVQDRQQKRRLHRIDEGVPFHDIRAPQETHTAQLNSVHYKVRLEHSTLSPTRGLATVPQVQLQHEVSSPLIDAASPLYALDHEWQADWKDQDNSQPYTSSPLLDSQSVDMTSCTLTTTPLIASSPPSLMLSIEEQTNDTYNQQHIVQLLDVAIRNSLCQHNVRIPKAITVISLGRQPLSSIAPAVFLPGFTEAMASRAPFITRISAALKDCTAAKHPAADQQDESSSTSSRLWYKMRHGLQLRCGKTRLKPLTLQLVPQSDQHSSDAMLSETSSAADMEPSSDIELPSDDDIFLDDLMDDAW